jgi:hypothetical protein
VVTPESIAAAVAPAVADAVAGLRDDLRPSEPAPAPAPTPAPEGDFTQQLLADPEGTINARVQDEIKSQLGQLAPYFQGLSDTAHSAIIQAHATEIDTRFGPGTYAEEFAPVLDKRFEQARKENPALLSSQDWINSEVNGVKGFKMDALVDRRGKFTTTQAEAQKAEDDRILSQVANATNLTGGVRPSGDKPREPTPAEEEYLRSRADSGRPMALEDLRKGQELGTSLKDWRAAKPKVEE